MIHVLLVLLAAGSPLPSAEGPVNALVSTRDLLTARNYTALTQRLEANQAAVEKDPAKAAEFGWILNAFDTADAATPGLIDNWVKADTKSWAPLLARAVNRSRRAAAARGAEWASKTGEDRFRGMAELNEGLRADCRAVLARNRLVCPCYRHLVKQAKSDGVNDPLADKAFQVCPRDYGLNVEHVFGLTPRWGGSYEAMRSAVAAARRRGIDSRYADMLDAYVPIDKASLLQIDGKLDEARAILDEAVKSSSAPVVFEERAELNYRRNDPPHALEDASAAIETSHGGWLFGVERLTRLLVARTWALSTLGRTDDAWADICLANKIAPADESVAEWYKYLGARRRKTP